MANDPNTIQYVIQEDGFWYVASKDRTPGVPEITVSAKGIVNGLSNIPNDGADFGPDTYNPNYTGSGIPYTQTSGIQEAIDYLPTTYPSGGTVKLTSGLFKITSGITITTPNVALVGESSQSNTSIGVISGSVSSVIKSTAFYTSIINVSIHGTTGTFPGTVATGIDFSQPSAIATNNIIDGTFFNGTFTDYILIMDNNDASVIRNTQLGNTTSASAMLSWKAPGGAKATISHCSTGSMDIAVQNLLIIGSYVSGLLVSENSIPLMVVEFVNCYQDSQTTMVTINSGVTVGSISYSGYFQIQNGGYVLTGSGTINKFALSGVALQVVSGALPLGWIDSTLTVNNYTEISGTFSGQAGETSIPNAPFSISNGLLTLPTPTTPTVPTSGTAQQNTNPYPVNVYIYGGDVTEIQITRGGTAYTVLSVSTAIAMSGQVYKLNPGDSITITYSTAPSWEWLSD